MKNCDRENPLAGSHDAARRAVRDLIHDGMNRRHYEVTMVLVFGEWVGAA
jgi:hypothetical protein